MLRRLVFALAAFALLLLAGILLLGPLYPTQDGPSHLYNAWLLTQRAQFTQWLEINGAALPQWFAPLLLAAQLKMGSIEDAYRWHLVIVALAGPLALWLVARDRMAGAIAAMTSVMLALGYPFTMGFFSYCLGQAFLLVVVGLFARWNCEVTIAKTVIFGALVTLLYWTHIVPFGLALGICGVLAIVDRMRGWPLLLGFVPGAALAVMYAEGAPKVPYVIAEHVTSPWWSRLKYLFLMPISTEPLFTQARWITFAMLIVVILAALVARTEDRRWQPFDIVALMGVGLIVISPLVPDGGGGGSLLQPRLADCGTWLLLLWVSQQQKVLLRLAMPLATVLVFAIVPILHTRYSYASWLQPTMRDIRSASHLIPEGQTILAITLWPTDYDPLDHERSYWTRPLEHAEGWIGVESKAFNLYNYEAASGVFPLQFTQPQSPELRLFQGHPPPVPVQFDLDGYLSGPNAALDYVLLINPYGPRREAVARVFEQVDRCCAFAARTPDGMVAIYRRRR